MLNDFFQNNFDAKIQRCQPCIKSSKRGQENAILKMKSKNQTSRSFMALETASVAERTCSFS